MRIQTPRESRREIVGRISERLGIPARYEGAPGFAYTIGEITVERDGGIVSGNDALLESLKPMLVEQGWLEAGPVDEQAARAENDSEADGPDASPERMDIVSPLRDWTVTERISLLRTLYGRQCLLNRMMQGETLCIEETFVTAMTDDPPASVADFEARVRAGIEAGAVRGVAFEDGKFISARPAARRKPRAGPLTASCWTASCEARRRQSACPSRRTLTRRAKSTAPTAGWCAWALPGLHTRSCGIR